MTRPWLSALRSGLNSWFQRKTSQLVDEPLQPLPRTQRLSLLQRIAALDAPPSLQSFVHKELTEAITGWRNNPEAANVMIVLGRPVESVAPVLEAVTAAWIEPSIPWHALLPCHHRPVDPAAVSKMLTAALENSLPATDSGTVLVSLPNLDQCFLRCIDGWSGVALLRQVILERQDCFWLLGCNSWAWQFLDHVSQISSYVPTTRTLPPLGGAALRDWLAPVATTVEIFKPNESAPVSAATWASEAEGDQVDLWSQLAELSSGSHRIASEIWVENLRVHPAGEGKQLLPARYVLPDFPSLMDEDRYILHSLLIHGRIRREHLAFGLGLPCHRLQPRIQWLLGEGLIHESAGELSVRPWHYPSLVKEMANSNLFTGEP